MSNYNDCPHLTTKKTNKCFCKQNEYNEKEEQPPLTNIFNSIDVDKKKINNTTNNQIDVKTEKNPKTNKNNTNTSSVNNSKNNNNLDNLDSQNYSVDDFSYLEGKLDEIELAIHLQGKKKICKSDCGNKKCKHKKVNKCKRNCCELIKKRRCQVKKNRADMSRMQIELANSLKMVVPKYSKRPKPTVGKGQGCGSPPRHTLPPLWMYSMATQRSRPRVPPTPIPPKRYPKSKAINKFRQNYADEIGTHRIYLYH